MLCDVSYQKFEFQEKDTAEEVVAEMVHFFVMFMKKKTGRSTNRLLPI